MHMYKKKISGSSVRKIFLFSLQKVEKRTRRPQVVWMENVGKKCTKKLKITLDEDIYRNVLQMRIATVTSKQLEQGLMVLI